MTLPQILALSSFAAIAAIWLGYPLLVWAAARLFAPHAPHHQLARRLPDHRTDDRTNAAPVSSVSVILATRESADVVRARIANLLDTAHPAHAIHIVVALDAAGAQCAPHELADIDVRVTAVLGDAPGGKASALNAGVRAATGELLVLADAHQRFDEQTIPALVAALLDTRVGAVSGALELGAGGGRSPVHLYWAMEKWLRHHEARIHSSVGVTGAVYATRRALWPVIPAGTLLDDVFVPMSLVLAGHRVGFSYAARAFDVRTFDSGNEGVRKTRTLTGVLQLRTLLPDIMSVRRNPIYPQFVAHKLLRLLTPLFGAVFAVSLAVVLVEFLLHASRTQLLTIMALVVVLLAVPASRRRIVALMRWAISLQLATARAVANGFSGRWGVWSKTRT